ncbi:MAG: DUF177 domain-containing protein [Candidatus Hydrogenedentes bacterium]|nr:DUF177 domain-containing protein [Candidatus Hydrogenedentota bacterium]
MATLEIPVTAIAGSGLHVDVTVPAEAVQPADIAPIPLGPVVVRGDLTPMVGQYLFQGVVEAVFFHPCDRCLEMAEFPVSLPVVWTFEEGPARESAVEGAEMAEEEAYGVFTFDGLTIDLARPVWDEVALALPVKFLCREDCLGLCPVCGVNRNAERCACIVESDEERPANNSGFAGLKDIFPDLPDRA